MTGLIKIDVNEKYEQIISARELHEKLGIGKDFTSWFKQQAERLNLKENRDFTPFWGESTGGRPSKDFLVPIDIAKHICMISGGEMAWKIRDHFIQVERAWNSPEQVMARALQISNRTIMALQSKVAEMQPKAEMHDVFLSATNAQTMLEACKALNIGRNKLFALLRNKQILMANNVPYQRYIDNGYFEVIQETIQKGRVQENVPTTLVTPKGINYIAGMLTQKRQLQIVQ